MLLKLEVESGYLQNPYTFEVCTVSHYLADMCISLLLYPTSVSLSHDIYTSCPTIYDNIQ